MDAVEFLKEADRMHNFDDQDCAGCEINKRRGDNLSCVNWVLSHPDEAVKVVEQWAKEHPRKTRQSEFLKMFPRVSMTADGIIAFCPDSMDSEFECPRKTRDNIDPICGECRREYWLEEVEE
nr:MAG TPA: hypothetical protein [Caudoviricetes sp.]